MHILFVPSWYNSNENPDDNNFISNQILGIQKFGIQAGVLFIQNTLHQFISGKIIPIEIKKRIHGSIAEVRLKSPLIPVRFRPGQWIIEKLAFKLYKIYAGKFGNPDIIHAHGYLAALMANYISQKTGIKYIITEHANDILTDSLKPGIRKKVKSAYENSHKLISVGHLLKSGMSKLTDKPIEVIPNCINTDLFFPVLNKEPGEKIILLISSYLFKHKHIDIALHAMKILKDEGIVNVELKIVGVGPEMNKLKELSKKLELQELVKFTGLVLNRNLPKVMQDADILLVTCPTETFCVALIEALSCGMTAIIPNSGEPSIYGKDFEVNTVNEHTAESYAYAITQMINLNHKLKKKHQFDLINARYSIEIVCQRLYNIYASELLGLESDENIPTR